MDTTSNRRRFLLQAGAVAIGASALSRHASAQPAPRLAPITMVINQSPWFGGFRQLVEQYTKETGNKIELDVNPYAGALDKIRNSLRAGAGSYDLLAIDNNWMVEFFDGGFLAPLADIDPAFRIDPQINTFGGTIYWNDKLHSFDPAAGKLMGVPVNGNVEVFYYRKDLYDQHRLRVPETWDQALDNATKLNDGSKVYGFVHRDDRESALADFVNYLFSFGGDLFANASTGDYSVVFNSPAARAALEFYLKLGKAGGYPTAGSVSQGNMIQLMATGKAAQAVGIVGAWAQLEDPAKSAVVGKFETALIPRGPNGKHSSRAGHWIGAIARDVARDRADPVRAPAGGARIPVVVPDARSPDRLHPLRRGAGARRHGQHRDRPRSQLPLPEGAGRKLEGREDVCSGTRSRADQLEAVVAPERVRDRQGIGSRYAEPGRRRHLRADDARRAQDRTTARPEVTGQAARVSRFGSAFRSGVMMSIGSGNTTVVFLSAPITVSVSR